MALLPLQVPSRAGVRPAVTDHPGQRGAEYSPTEGLLHAAALAQGSSSLQDSLHDCLSKTRPTPILDNLGQNREAQTRFASDRTSQPPWIVAPSLSHAALGKAKPTRGTIAPVRRTDLVHHQFRRWKGQLRVSSSSRTAPEDQMLCPPISNIDPKEGRIQEYKRIARPLLDANHDREATTFEEEALPRLLLQVRELRDSCMCSQCAAATKKQMSLLGRGCFLQARFV